MLDSITWRQSLVTYVSCAGFGTKNKADLLEAKIERLSY